VKRRENVGALENLTLDITIRAFYQRKQTVISVSDDGAGIVTSDESKLKLSKRFNQVPLNLKP
jgi:signal transduction histidine kinase